MSCCLQTPTIPPPPRPVESGAWRWLRGSAASATRFEYTGHASLVVIGPYSGRRYHFPAPGARLEVDPRDRTAFLAVPVLRPAAP
jgi:hypothetical protein